MEFLRTPEEQDDLINAIKKIENTDELDLKEELLKLSDKQLDKLHGHFHVKGYDLFFSQEK